MISPVLPAMVGGLKAYWTQARPGMQWRTSLVPS